MCEGKGCGSINDNQRMPDDPESVRGVGLIGDNFMSIVVQKTIFMDESGHTGSDHLNSEQKVFVLASTDFEESEARKLIDKPHPS